MAKKPAAKKPAKKPAKAAAAKKKDTKSPAKSKAVKSAKKELTKKSKTAKVVTSKKAAPKKAAPKKAVKKTALEEKLDKKAKVAAKAKKAEKAVKGESAAVHTETRTGKSKMPSILTSPAFLEMTKHIDSEEKKLGIDRATLTVGGHVENAISTGVLMHDFVNGGGYAPGRFTVTPGLEGSGKCCLGDTLIHTSRGIVRIDSLFRNDDAWDTLIPRRIRINTAEGPRMTSHVARRYARDLYEISGKFSQTLKLTGDHKVRVVNKKTGALAWLEAKKVKAGDVMFVKRSHSESVFGRYGNDDYEKTMLGTLGGKEVRVSKKLAYAIGVMYADGALAGNAIRVSKKNNLSVLDRYAKSLAKAFGSDSFTRNAFHRSSKQGQYYYHTVTLRAATTDFVRGIGVKDSGGRDKVIPEFIMRGNKEIVTTFLRAYFSCDYTGEGIASKEMATQLAQLLLSVGIPTNMRVKNVKTQKGTLPYYTLTFGPFKAEFDSLACFRDAEDKNGEERVVNRNNFVNGHGWLSYAFAKDVLDKFKAPLKDKNNGSYLVNGEYKKLNLFYDKNVTQAQLLANDGALADSIHEVLPDLGNTLDFIINNDLIAVEIESVTRVPGKFPVYDVTVPDGHNFIANGFIVHNSTQIVTSTAQAVQQNVPVYIADAEAAFDAGYADRALSRFGHSMKQMQGVFDPKKGIWVEPPMVRISQDNNGEKIFRLFRRIMRELPVIRRDYEGNWWAITKDAKGKETVVEHSGLPQMMFFIDSLAALIPNILDGDDEKETIGAQALMFSRMLPKIASLMTTRHCIVIGSNQLRVKIGGFTRPGMPPPTTQPGGEALKFYTDIRTGINACASSTAGWHKSTQSYFEEKSIYGGVDRYVFTCFRNQKNKAFIPKREGYARIRFMKDGAPGDGYCETFDTLSFLEATGQLTRRGNTLKLDIQGVTRKKDAPGNLPVDPHAAKLDYMAFKIAVEDPKNKHVLWNHCRQQIKTGFAFALERERVTNNKKVDSHEEE